MRRISGIYSITCQENDRRYIGSSMNITARWYAHKWALRHGRHYNTHLQRAWDKYGESKFVFEILEECENSALRDRETHWTVHYQSCHYMSGFNDRDPNNIKRPSVETIAIIAEKKRGQKASIETRMKMSQSRMGHSTSQETREKISKAHRGREKTPKMKEMLRKLAIGRSPSESTKLKMRAACSKEYVVTDPDGNEYHIKGLACFCNQHGLNPRRMSDVVYGKQTRHRGWKCRLAN